LESLLEQVGVESQRLRSKIRQYEKYGDRIQLCDFHGVREDDVFEMVEKHFAPHDSYAISYANMIRIIAERDRGISSPPPLGIESFVPTIDGAPIGFFASEILDEKSAGVYASIASHHFPGLGEAMLRALLKRLRSAGILYVNLGGSETAGLDRYKRKFSAESKTIPILTLWLPVQH
jgi:hypothetical protein